MSETLNANNALSNARRSPLGIGKWRKTTLNGLSNGNHAKNGSIHKTVNSDTNRQVNGFVKDRNFNNEVTDEGANSTPSPSTDIPTAVPIVGNRYDCFKRIKIVLMNESGVVYEYMPKGGHVADVLKPATIEEMVFGSVAINFVMEDPLFKIHQLPDILTLSLVMSVKSESREKRSKNESSPKAVWKKWGLVVMFDTSAEVKFIREYVLKQSHLIYCSIVNLRDDLLNGLAMKSSILVNDSTKRFLQSVNSVLCAQILSTCVSMQSFVEDLICLIKQTDTKTTNFFLSKLISALFIYKNRLNTGLQVIITSSQRNLSLLNKLLIVLRYFLSNCHSYDAHFADPVINISSYAPSGHLAANGNFKTASSNSHHLSTEGSIIRKSRDESLGYGSLSDSETNVCQTSENSTLQMEYNSYNDASKPKFLNQSKLYIKEYQSLRFDKTSNLVEKPNNDTKSSDVIDSCLIKKKTSRSSASSGYCDDDDLMQDLLKSNHLNGFGEMDLPPVISKEQTSPANAIDASLTREPVITDVYLRHFALQGVLRKKGSTTMDFVNNCACRCSERTEVIINGDVDVWTVNVTSLKSNSTVPAMMCTQIGQICESLVALDAIDMKPDFILGHLECKLNELRLKSKILQVLQVDRCSLAMKAQSILSLTDYNTLFDSGPDLISPILGFDVSDLPLLSIISQSGNACSSSSSRSLRQAETSL